MCFVFVSFLFPLFISPAHNACQRKALSLVFYDTLFKNCSFYVVRNLCVRLLSSLPKRSLSNKEFSYRSAIDGMVVSRKKYRLSEPDRMRIVRTIKATDKRFDRNPMSFSANEGKAINLRRARIKLPTIRIHTRELSPHGINLLVKGHEREIKMRYTERYRTPIGKTS